MANAKNSGPVDLSVFDTAMKRQDEGLAVKIVGPDGKTELGFTITVAGRDSKRAEAAQDALNEELVDRQVDEPLSAAERRERSVAYLAKLTIGWAPNVILDGKELPFSEENAAKLYARHPFIREQVDLAAGSRVRFIAG